MMRKCITILVVSILLGASAFAQYKQTGGFARLQGMGNNPYVIDPYVSTVNPAWAGYYPNFLFGDLGSSTGAFASGGVGQFISANFHVGSGLTLGGMLTRNDFNGGSIGRLDPGGLVSQINGIVGAGAVLSLNNNLELLGSYKSGNYVFGFGVAYASTTNENNPATGNGTTGSASQIGFNAGFITKVNNILIDVGASFVLPSASFEPATGNKTELSQTIIGVNARAFFRHSSKLSFVPSVVFATASGTADIGGATTTTSSDLPSATGISVGIGVNYEVGDFLLAGGPGFATASVTQSSTPTSPELTTSVLVFPIWNLGVEWNMNDWFVARFGYVASTQKTTTETAASTTTVDETIATTFQGPNGATVGVGFRLGNFSLDATVNEDVLRQGLSNIGGGGIAGATFAYLSLSYSIP
jgi:hypothetical protein